MEEGLGSRTVKWSWPQTWTEDEVHWTRRFYATGNWANTMNSSLSGSWFVASIASYTWFSVPEIRALTPGTALETGQLHRLVHRSHRP